MSILRAQSVVSGYGSMEVLHGVTFEVEKGQIVALLGPTIACARDREDGGTAAGRRVLLPWGHDGFDFGGLNDDDGWNDG